MTPLAVLRSMIEGNRSGKQTGMPSWCTAHPDTLRAILRAHRDNNDPILVEATCNQVNQHGGYTGMTPAGFRTFVERLAKEEGIRTSRIILGGDHLGPNPWKNRPASEAMAEAGEMLRAYVNAGFSKIHLDASMACADDMALTEVVMAERAAELCAVAEKASGNAGVCYVIGTEVPVPGGETQPLEVLAVTKPQPALRTFELHREAFARRGLSAAFARVIGMVVQPGVDFGNAQIFAYQKEKAATLTASLGRFPATVFEAHSTDYQTEGALTDLVAGHFAFLKVGPELTFAFREAVTAMAAIEAWLAPVKPSNILKVISDVMDADPKQWRSYVQGGRDEKMMKLFGLSDRVRYYWPSPEIVAALQCLRKNIDTISIAPGLLSQYTGHMEVAAGVPLSDRIIQYKVGAVVSKYRRACGSTLLT